MSKRGSRGILIAASAVVLVVDQVTKAVAVMSGDVHLNPGVAFGMLASTPVLADIAAMGMTVVVIAMAWRWSHGVWSALGWGLLVGGAVGNAVDRWLPPSGIVDWIRVSGYPAYFNVADIAVRSGVALLLLGLITAAVREWRRSRPELLQHEAAASAEVAAQRP